MSYCFTGKRNSILNYNSKNSTHNQTLKITAKKVLLGFLTMESFLYLNSQKN